MNNEVSFKDHTDQSAFKKMDELHPNAVAMILKHKKVENMN
jgi:hypothetical protein